MGAGGGHFRHVGLSPRGHQSVHANHEFAVAITAFLQRFDNLPAGGLLLGRRNRVFKIEN